MDSFQNNMSSEKSRMSAFTLTPHMCRLVFDIRFSMKSLSVPHPPIPENAHIFITRLYKNRQKPKFRQCYFLGKHLEYQKLDILGHILVPVSEGPGEGVMYLDIAAGLYLFLLLFRELFCKISLQF